MENFIFCVVPFRYISGQKYDDGQTGTNKVSFAL